MKHLLEIFKLFLALELVVSAPHGGRSLNEIQRFQEFLLKSRTVDKNHFQNAMKKHPEINPEELSGKFEGDIDLDEDLITKLIDIYSGESRNALIDESKRWPNNTVVYEIDDGAFDEEEEQKIFSAFLDIENNTCISFRKRNDKDSHYLKITGADTGCHSEVGFQPTKSYQTVNLTPKRCFIHGTICHEIMHTLGIYHMQSTYDRDDWVNIVEENIKPEMMHNFMKYKKEEVTNLGLEYDYGSVMHYGSTAFSINGDDTIIPLKPFSGKIGQRIGPSSDDWIRINRLYKCPNNWSTQHFEISHKI